MLLTFCYESSGDKWGFSVLQVLVTIHNAASTKFPVKILMYGHHVISQVQCIYQP